jgi:hypothetical protein
VGAGFSTLNSAQSSFVQGMRVPLPLTMGIAVTAGDGDETAILDPSIFATTPKTSAAAWASDQFILLTSNTAWSGAAAAEPIVANDIQSAQTSSTSQPSNTSHASVPVRASRFSLKYLGSIFFC